MDDIVDPFKPQSSDDVVDPFKAEAKPPAPDKGALNAGVRGAIQGATFNFADEARAIDEAGGAAPDEPGTPLHTIKGLYKYWTGDKEAEQRYNDAVARERSTDTAAKKQHPYAYGAGEVAGSLPSMAVLPELGAAKLAGAPGAGILRGAITGGEYGALSGAGEQSGSDRVSGAVGGGAAGIVGGGVAGGISDVISSLAKPIAGAFRAWKDPEAEASRRLSVALRADQDLIAAGKADGMSPQDWMSAYSRGEPVTLADLGASNTQSLLRSSANTSPDGRAMLEKTFGDRFAGQSERVANEVRDLVPGGANAGKTADQLVAEYDQGRAPLYNRSFAEGDKEITSPTMERLMGSPVVEQAMKNAVSSGKDRAIANGYGAFNPGVTVENGMIKFTKTKPNGVPQYPNLQYWDSVKKELDSVGQVAARSGDKDKAGIAGQLATTLRGELDKQVPSYANARGFAETFFGEKNSLEAGRALAGKKVDPQVIKDAMRKMKPDEQNLFREGYASDWANRVIENVKDTADITKAMFNSPNERKRALAVFGPAGMAKMEARMSLETIMDGARKAMGNSTTARQLIEAGLAGGVAGYETNWNPWAMAGMAAGTLGAPKIIGTTLTGAAQKLIGKVDSKTATKVAELLTSDDPRKLQTGLTMAEKNPRVAASLKWMASHIGTAAQASSQLGPRRLVMDMTPKMQGPSPGYGADQKQQ